MPVQNKSPPVKKYTTIAMSIAGMSTKKSLMRTMMTKPMMTKIMQKNPINASESEAIQYRVDDCH